MKRIITLLLFVCISFTLVACTPQSLQSSVTSSVVQPDTDSSEDNRAGGITDMSAEVGIFDLENKSVLLNSGYEMSILGMGTYSLSDEECFNSVTALLEAGRRLIDTAHIYGNEESVGRAVRESDVPRGEIFVITKLYPDQFGSAAEAIDEALEKMDIGYIDMMLLHHPGTSDVTAYKAMEQAVADGKIRSVVQGWYPLGGRGHTKELLGDETISAIAQAHKVSSAQVILRWN